MRVGYKHSPEVLRRLAAINRRNGIRRRGVMPKNLSSLQGENHWNWRGGIDTKEHRSLVKNRRNRAIQSVPGAHSDLEWHKLKQRFLFLCVGCGKRKRLTKDHIIPVGHPECTNDISNIQPLCNACNTQKGSKIIRFLMPTVA